jgi:hypothetical protein
MRFRWLLLILAVLLVTWGTVGCAAATQSAQYSTTVYKDLGGDRQVWASGGQALFESGAVAEAQAGSTVYLSGTNYISDTLYLEGRQFSGPVRFGSATALATPVTVTHGLGVTPTSIILTPYYNGALTQTAFITGSNSTSFTILLESGPVTTTTVYWMAGR